MATPANSIFVKGLAKALSERHLQQIFAPYGDLTGVQIARHRSGRSAGFAIVTYLTHTDARRALQVMDNQNVSGRRLNVRWYTPEMQQSCLGLSPDDTGGLAQALAALGLVGLQAPGTMPGSDYQMLSQVGMPELGLPGLGSIPAPPPGAGLTWGTAWVANNTAHAAVSSPRPARNGHLAGGASKAGASTTSLLRAHTSDHISPGSQLFDTALSSWFDSTAAAGINSTCGSTTFQGAPGLDLLRHSIDTSAPARYGVGQRRSTQHSAARLSLDGLDLSALTVQAVFGSCQDDEADDYVFSTDPCCDNPWPANMGVGVADQTAWKECVSPASGSSDARCSSSTGSGPDFVVAGPLPRQCSDFVSGMSYSVPQRVPSALTAMACGIAGSQQRNGRLELNNMHTDAYCVAAAAGRDIKIGALGFGVGGATGAAPLQMKLPNNLDCFERSAPSSGQGTPRAPGLPKPAQAYQARPTGLLSSPRSALPLQMSTAFAPNPNTVGASSMMLRGGSGSLLSPGRGPSSDRNDGFYAAMGGVALSSLSSSSLHHQHQPPGGALGLRTAMSMEAAILQAAQAEQMIAHLSAVRSQALLAIHQASLQQTGAGPVQGAQQQRYHHPQGMF